MQFKTATLVLLLVGATAFGAAADGLVRNFHIASVNRTHVTFSWDLEGAYHSHVDQYSIYYRASYPGAGSYTYDSFYTVNTPTQVGNGRTFTHTASVTAFNNYGQYIMWLQVKTLITPPQLFSEQIYAELGAMVAIELNIKLWDGQTCHDFTQQSTGISGAVGDQVYRALRIYCKCTFDFIKSFSVFAEYLMCSSPRYVTMRGYIRSTDVTKHPSTLVGALNNWLQDTNNSTIIVYGKQYTVEAGPCGVTVPYTNSPSCLVNTPIESTSAGTTTAGSSETAPHVDIAVIVASASAAMFFILALSLVIYVMAIKCPSRTISQPTSRSAVGCRTTECIVSQVPTTTSSDRQQSKAHIEQFYDDMNQ